MSSGIYFLLQSIGKGRHKERQASSSLCLSSLSLKTFSVVLFYLSSYKTRDPSRRSDTVLVQTLRSVVGPELPAVSLSSVVLFKIYIQQNYHKHDRHQ